MNRFFFSYMSLKIETIVKRCWILKNLEGVRFTWFSLNSLRVYENAFSVFEMIFLSLNTFLDNAKFYHRFSNILISLANLLNSRLIYIILQSYTLYYSIFLLPLIPSHRQKLFLLTFSPPQILVSPTKNVWRKCGHSFDESHERSNFQKS